MVSFFFVASLTWSNFVVTRLGDTGALRPPDTKLGSKVAVLSEVLVGGRCEIFVDDVRNRTGGSGVVGDEGSPETNIHFDPPFFLGLSVQTWFIMAVSTPAVSLISKSFNRAADGDGEGNGECVRPGNGERIHGVLDRGVIPFFPFKPSLRSCFKVSSIEYAFTGSIHSSVFEITPCL